MERADKQKEGMTLVEVMVSMAISAMMIAGLFTTVSMAKQMDYSSEEKTAAFFYCKSVLEGLRGVELGELCVVDDTDDGNNGHGNDPEGFDPSNPGKSTGTANGKTTCKCNGICVCSSATETTYEWEYDGVVFHRRDGVSSTELTGTELVEITPTTIGTLDCYEVSISLTWDSYKGIKRNSESSESVYAVIYQ
jgi:prepilin-type N-terminal cleavage/methylation domain-containing protein